MEYDSNENTQSTARKGARKILITVIAIIVFAAVVAATVVIFGMVKKNNAYNDALALMNAGQYEEAIEAFKALDDYKDSAQQIRMAKNAIEELERLEALDAAYADALTLMEAGQYEQAIQAFTELDGHRDSDEQIQLAWKIMQQEADYNRAMELLQSDDSANDNEAYTILKELGEYKDAKQLLEDFRYALITEKSESSISGNGDYVYHYQYDSLGRLAAKRYENGKEISFAYDANGRLTEKRGISGWDNTTYRYNDNGTLQETKHAISRNTGSGIVSYAIALFDEQGYPLRIANEFENEVWTYQYSFGQDGGPESIEVSCRNLKSGGAEKTILIDMSEYDSGELIPDTYLRFPLFWEVSDDGLTKTSYKLYNDYFDGILVKICNTYKYDTNGNPTREIQYDNAGNQSYNYSYENSYDEQGNLIQVKRQNAGSDVVVTYHYIYGYIYAPDAA